MTVYHSAMFAKVCIALSTGLFLNQVALTQRVAVEKVEDQPGFGIESAEVSDLSGIVWTGGDSFYAVSDRKNALVPLTLNVDPATGRIASGKIGEPIPVLSDASDFEGVTYVAAERAFYISAETGNTVVRFAPGQPRAERLPVPPIFAQARKNLSLESLTWNDTTKQFWIANEEALVPDLSVAGPEAGSLVRLQRLDAKFRPVAQYAWRTEPTSFRFHGAGNGVVDLCALPDGGLLVLERGFGAGGLHMRLFLADFQNATDTSRLPAIANADCAAAHKIPLFDQATGFTNFEGLALGPKLDDGARSLILIADSNGGFTHTFLPLKIRLAPAEVMAKKPPGDSAKQKRR